MRRPFACLLFAASLLPGVAAAAECDDWVATVVSVQGSIEARRAGETQWQMVAPGGRYCLGDTIRAQERSRAAILLRNDALLRLDQNTTVTFSGPKEGPASWVDVLRGVVHFISRVPRVLKVLTPFVNGTVEGTEFLAEVEADRATLTVFEGRVVADNAAGRLTLRSGQSAIARVGQAPAPVVVVRPRDAVEWALYYPAIADARPEDFPDIAGQAWPALVRRSIEFYRRGDLPGAFASLEPAGPDVADPRFFTYRAGLLLLVGRVDDARADVENALRLDPAHGPALALQAIIAVVRNDTGEALRLGRLAVAAAPQSAAARVAFSYAQQASFDLSGALGSLREAVKLGPEDSLAWARLAELWLSFGKLTDALHAAAEAARLNPDLARTQSVLGFAHLTQQKTKAAQQAFERAIQLDQADPLPRLGLGLARIRRGDLEEGRRDIEIAASLDPNRSLDRSYLGKAYYEERRDEPAREELATAKALDPTDPTPWFYDAVRKQSVNRPVEALHDLQRAIELNDNRAIYRSRLLLDEDLAARSASLARIYDDLGFRQRALVEGWRSVNVDPGNYSAHRFLADSYSVLPRHEIARVSEVLQSQLLQPININPVPPQLALADSFILSGTGPATASFNEFNPLFERNRFSFRASGVAGGNETFGDELVQSGLWGNFAYSLGQFHFESQGFRPNDLLKQDIYNVFAQVGLTHNTSIQTEFRKKETETGDLPLRFDPTLFDPDRRAKERIEFIRFGFRHAFVPNSTLVGSALYQSKTQTLAFGPFLSSRVDQNGFTAEIQHLFRTKHLTVITGLGWTEEDREDFQFPFVSPMKKTNHQTNGYLYSNINYPKDITLTVGASVDFFETDRVSGDQFNPKAGVTWNPVPSTTLRAAVFRTFNRTLLSGQTIEPTEVAGFNQFFDDEAGSRAWRYGIGVDHKFSPGLYTGGEYSWRSLEVPGLSEPITRADWKERLGRAYLDWTPGSWLAITVEYLYERFERSVDFENFGLPTDIRTHRIPLGINVFAPFGLTSQLKATYVAQRADVPDSTGTVVVGRDQFWVVDGSVGYRLPKRLGLISLEARNLFNQQFKFQDTDPANPQLLPERLILIKATLAY